MNFDDVVEISVTRSVYVCPREQLQLICEYALQLLSSCDAQLNLMGVLFLPHNGLLRQLKQQQMWVEGLLLVMKVVDHECHQEYLDLLDGPLETCRVEVQLLTLLHSAVNQPQLLGVALV